MAGSIFGRSPRRRVPHPPQDDDSIRFTVQDLYSYLEILEQFNQADNAYMEGVYFDLLKQYPQNVRVQWSSGRSVRCVTTRNSGQRMFVFHIGRYIGDDVFEGMLIYTMAAAAFGEVIAADFDERISKLKIQVKEGLGVDLNTYAAPEIEKTKGKIIITTPSPKGSWNGHKTRREKSGVQYTDKQVTKWARQYSSLFFNGKYHHDTDRELFVFLKGEEHEDSNLIVYISKRGRGIIFHEFHVGYNVPVSQVRKLLIWLMAQGRVRGTMAMLIEEREGFTFDTMAKDFPINSGETTSVYQNLEDFEKRGVVQQVLSVKSIPGIDLEGCGCHAKEVDTKGGIGRAFDRYWGSGDGEYGKSERERIKTLMKRRTREGVDTKGGFGRGRPVSRVRTRGERLRERLDKREKTLQSEWETMTTLHYQLYSRREFLIKGTVDTTLTRREFLKERQILLDNWKTKVELIEGKSPVISTRIGEGGDVDDVIKEIFLDIEDRVQQRWRKRINWGNQILRDYKIKPLQMNLKQYYEAEYGLEDEKLDSENKALSRSKLSLGRRKKRGKKGRRRGKRKYGGRY